MQKFTSLYRKTLLNYCSGWEFVLSVSKYPIIMYINLHNINNATLHQIKHYMSTIQGSAQVLSTNQLTSLFAQNLKFKFLLTGNIVALRFTKWFDVWGFKNYAQSLNLIIATISVNGVFFNLGSYSLNDLEQMFNHNNNVMIKITTQLTKINVDIYYYLIQYLIILQNTILMILDQFIQCLKHTCSLLEYKKNN